LSTPNSSAKAIVKNDWGSMISKVELTHRYDHDHFDVKTWESISNGFSGDPFDIYFWTRSDRTGKDYWVISFEAEGKIWTCKDNFSCILKNNDKGGTVTCRVYKESNKGKLEIICPKSSRCKVSLNSSPVPLKNTRPVYVVAHRCNDYGEVGLAISGGCNAVECDLQYNEKSKEVFVNHDLPIGTTLDEWIKNAKEIKDLYPNRFSLIIFDCKFANSLEDNVNADIFLKVRKISREILNPEGSVKINTIFSIASLDHRKGFDKIMKDLLPHEGIAIDQCDKPVDVEKFFAENSVENCWYGDGIATIGAKDVFPFIKEGCDLRDAHGRFKKVYVWTLAKEDSIKKFYEQAGVDAVFINVPGTLNASPFGLEDALKVVNESKLMRYSERSDPAFKVYKKPDSSQSIS
jgi:hypothetical protein